MIQQSYYTYVKEDARYVWAVGLWEGDYDHSRSHHAQSMLIPHDRMSMKLRLTNTYGKSISELIMESIGVEPNLPDAELKKMFFSSNPSCRLSMIALSCIDEKALLQIIYEASGDTQRMCLFITDDSSMMLEVDYRDGSPVSRHLIQFKKERQPRDAVLQRNARKLPEWVYTFVDDEYLGARKVRRIEIRSDNFGQRVEDGYAYAHITEY